MYVSVYRNLRHGKNTRPLYSIRYKGKVIAREHRVLLRDCMFSVQEAGRRRVLQTGVKNVHAFVRGWLVGSEGAYGQDKDGKDLPVKVRYNPSVAGYFYIEPNRPDVAIGNRIDYARAVLLNENGISAAYTVTQ